MKKAGSALIVILLLFVQAGHAQFNLTPEQRARQDSIRKISEQDHKRLMEQLGITSLRPGANGNDPNAPNAANYEKPKPIHILPCLIRFC